MREDPQTGRIIVFPVDGRRALSIKDQTVRLCPHLHTLLSERDRTLECEDCGKGIDPIQYLIEWAQKLRRIEYDIRTWEALQREGKGVTYDCALKKEVAKIKERPSDPIAREVWDEAARLMGDTLFAISKRKNAAGGWWVHEFIEKDGMRMSATALSIEYVRHLNAQSKTISIGKRK